MASPFRESIDKLLNGIEGAVSCALMGFDGITVDISAKEAAAGGPDIQTLSMEFAHLIAQARRTLESVDAGALEEFTLRKAVILIFTGENGFERSNDRGSVPLRLR